jgi:hypothetical protein
VAGDAPVKVHELVDAFDAPLDPATWNVSGSAATAGGRLSLPVTSPYFDPELQETIPPAAISSVERLDFTGSRAVLELVTIPTSVRSSVSLSISTGSDLGETVWWRIDAGIIGATRYVDQQQTDGWTAPFDPVEHRWVALRHEPGVIVWATSRDGITWVDRSQLMATFPVDDVQLGVGALLQELADPGDDDGIYPPPALFDNLNNPPGIPSDDPLTEIVGDGSAPNLAIDLNVAGSENGSLILDESVLDGYALLGWQDNPTGWVNIVCDVTRVQIARGATTVLGPLTQTEAGSCSVQLVDYERRIDPTINGDVIHPGTPVRVRAWGGNDPTAPDWSAVLFTGRVSGEGIAVAYSRVDPPVVTFTASDRVGELVRWESIGHPAPGVGDGDDLLERVNRVLTEVGIENGVALGSDAVYLATLAPATLEKAWAAISDATRAELGRVWVTSSNALVVRGRGSVLSGPVRGTLSDWHGETIEGAEVHCCYVDPSVRYSPEQLVNRVIAGRAGTGAAAPVQIEDEVSRVLHGTQVARETGLVLADDVQVLPWARSLLSTNTEPRVRVERVSPAPWGAPEAWPAVCATDIGDRWLFRLHPQLGPTVREAVGVLGIEHEITAESWSTTWFTAWAPAPGANPSGWFMLDVSVLDEGDVLAPFA